MWRVSRGLVNFSGKLTHDEVDELAKDPDIRVLQCSSAIEFDTWDLLNQGLFARRPDIALRVYGFYGSVCDLSFVSRMHNVQRFSADCLLKATGVQHISGLPNLKELSIGIYNLDSFDFLEHVPSGITRLSLEATKSRKPSLAILSKFRSLRRLYIEGQQRDIEVLSELPELEDLTLRSITTPSLDYIANLPRLWSLDIKLGGTKNLSAIAEKESIKYLELWQIRGLDDVSVVSSLRGLQFLFLQSLKNVSRIPDLSRLAKLRRIYLDNLKGLKNVRAIFHAPALEEFIHISAQNIAPDTYRELMKMPSLKQVSVGFCSRRKTVEFNNLVDRSGKTEYRYTDFDFR